MVLPLTAGSSLLGGVRDRATRERAGGGDRTCAGDLRSGDRERGREREGDRLRERDRERPRRRPPSRRGGFLAHYVDGGGRGGGGKGW